MTFPDEIFRRVIVLGNYGPALVDMQPLFGKNRCCAAGEVEAQFFVLK